MSFTVAMNSTPRVGGADVSAEKLDSAGCYQCSSSNDPAARFCASCGSALFENCGSCGNPARIGQQFCGGCGFHLLAAVEQRIASCRERLADAEAAMREFAFDRAADLLRWLHDGNDDQRLTELKKSGGELWAELCRLRDHWNAKIEAITATAEQAERSLDHAAVLASLQEVPERLMSDVLRDKQSRAETAIQEQQSLRRKLKEAIKAKDYLQVGSAVDALLGLEPEEAQWLALAAQVSGLLIKSASADFREGRFAGALERLLAVPRCQQDAPQYQKLKQSVDDAVWITDQIARSPFATPALAGMARRLAAMAPENERIGKAVRELTECVRTGPNDPLSLFAPWTGASTGWNGAAVSIAGRTRRVLWSEHKELNQNPTRVAIAIGLALQGLGESQVDGYRSGGRSLGGLIGRLGRQTTQAAWGVDVGASAVRAVRLQRHGEAIKISDLIWLPIDQLACRASQSRPGNSAAALAEQPELAARLRELAMKMGADDAPVWANLPARDVLARFLALPPLPEKKLAKLLEQERATQFPVPAEQLVTASGVTGVGADGSPRAVIVASKKTTVEQRQGLFADAGLRITGIQSDPLALHHLAAYEWADLTAVSAGSPPERPALAVLDCGAQGTTCYVATADGFWFRHFGCGGQDLTSKLAAVGHLTHQQAEAMRIQPAKLTPLASGMEAMAKRLEQLAGQLAQALPQASQSLGKIQLQHILCTGGAALHHGWTRHAIAADLSVV